MSGGSFDPCECIWNHESAMQRLINLLRNSQDTCTDNQCMTSLPGPSGDPTSGGSMMMMMMIGWLVMATALYFLRPASLRDRGDQKPGPGGNDSNGPPPPAPGVH